VPVPGIPAISGSGSQSGFGGRISVGLLDPGQSVGFEAIFTPATFEGTLFHEVAGSLTLAS
jgi:hypothetical protein